MMKLHNHELNGLKLNKTVLENLKVKKNNALLETRLNASLRNNLAHFFFGNDQIQQSIQKFPDIGIVSHSVTPVRTLLMTEVGEKITTDQEVKTKFENSLAQIPTNMTVGDILQLNKPIADHPIFQDLVTDVKASSLIKTASLPPMVISKFLTLYQQHSYYPSDSLWDAANKDKDLSEHVGELQFTILLGKVTQNNIPLVKEIHLLHQAGTIKVEQDLVNVDWNATICGGVENGTIQIPSNIDGKTTEEKTHNYIASIVDTVDSTYPSAAFSRDLSNNLARGDGMVREFDHPMAQAFSTFFKACPDFDLQKTDVRSYLSENRTAAFGTIDVDHQKFTATLMQSQRLFRVTPKYDEFSTLQVAGFGSAYDIATIPKANFVKNFGSKLGGGEERAAEIHATASRRAHISLSYMAKFSQRFNNVNVAAISNYNLQFREPITSEPNFATDPSLATDPDLGPSPNWETLFGSGSLDWIDCEDCKSVTSPAAYFANLLSFLKRSQKDSAWETMGEFPLTELFRRRPDLWYLALSCENTETTLPYIDLVNEILENYVVKRLVDPSYVDTAPVFYWDRVGLTGGNSPASPNSSLLSFFNDHFGIEINYPLDWDTDDLRHKSFLCPSVTGRAKITIVRDIATTRSGPCVPVSSSGDTWSGSLDHDPLAPTGLTASPSSTEISLKWDAPSSTLEFGPSEVIGFFLERSSNEGVTWQPIWEGEMDNGSGPPVSYSDNNLGAVGTRYWYRVSSIIGYLQTTTAKATIAMLDDGANRDVWDRQSCDFIILQNLKRPLWRRKASLKKPNKKDDGATDGQYPVYQMIQTCGTSNELNANPQHTNVKAYEIIRSWTDSTSGKKGQFPIDLPFDLWVEQARAYLKQLGSSLYEAMSTLRSEGILMKRSTASDAASLAGPSGHLANLDPLVPSNLKVERKPGLSGVTLTWTAPAATRDDYHKKIIGYSIERSQATAWTVISNVYGTDSIPPGTSYIDTSVIGGENPSYRVSAILSDINVASACEYLGLSPADHTAITDNITAKDWLHDFEPEPIPVQRFLNKTGLLYTDLISLLETGFINPNKTVEITIDPQHPNNLSAMKIVRLDTIDEGGKIPRFIRLWRKLAWDMKDLDKVLVALCPDVDTMDITDAVLLNLAAVAQIQSKLGLPLMNVCALFTTMDTRGNDSLYSQIFQNTTIKNPPDAAFELNSEASALLVEDPKHIREPLSSHSANIVAAFGITSDDLSTMTAFDESLDDSAVVRSLKVTDNHLTLDNLSKLYRIASLSQALNLSVQDLLSLIQLSQINPFDQVGVLHSVRDLDKIQQFIMIAEEVASSGFSVAELNYLIRDVYDLEDGIRPIDQDIAQFFSDLIGKLQKIRQQSMSIVDPDGQLLRKNLPLILTPDRNTDFQSKSFVNNWVEKLVSIIDGSSTDTYESAGQYIEDLFNYIYASQQSPLAKELLVQPTPPTGLSASLSFHPLADKKLQIDLSWNAQNATSIIGYKVESSTDGGSTWKLLGTTADTKYSNTELKSGTLYKYRVKSLNSALVESIPTNQAVDVATPSTDTPSPPRTLTAALIFDSNSTPPAVKINLNWDVPVYSGLDSSGAITDITGYMIEVSLDGGASWPSSPLMPRTPSNATFYQHTPSPVPKTLLPSNATYTYRVRAINKNLKVSDSAQGTTISVVPSAPSGLKVTSVSPMEIDLNWTAPAIIQIPTGQSPQIVGYMIEQSKDGGNTWPGLPLVPNTMSVATSYADKSVDVDKTYFYRISALTIGQSQPSDYPAAASPVNAYAPTDVTVTGGNLNWVAPTLSAIPPGFTLIGFLVEVSSDKDKTWATFGQTATTVSSLPLPNDPGKTYRVSAILKGKVSEPISTSILLPTTRSGKFSYVTSRVMRYLMSLNMIQQSFAGFLKMPTDVISLLLTKNLVQSQSQQSPPLIEYFLDDNFIASDLSLAINPPNFPHQFSTLYTISKTSLIVKKFNISSNQIEYLVDHASKFANFNPVFYFKNDGQSTSDTFSFTEWEELYNLFSLQNSLTGGGGGSTLFEFFNKTYAPTGLDASLSLSPDSAIQIQLNWTAPNMDSSSSEVIRGYEIERSDDGGLTWSTAGKTISLGQSQPSDSQSGSILNPYAPTGLAISGTGTELSWKAPSEVTTGSGLTVSGYLVDISSDKDRSWALFGQTSGSVTSIQVPNNPNNSYRVSAVLVGPKTTQYVDRYLPSEKTYTYRVSSVFRIGKSGPSSPAHATVPASHIPSPPLAVRASVRTATEIYVTWSPPTLTGGSPIIGYMIERSHDNGLTWSTLIQNTGSPGTGPYHDTNYMEDTTYMYRVSAINSLSNKQPSYPSDPSAPLRTPAAQTSSSPIALTASVSPTSANEIDLDWVAPSYSGGVDINSNPITIGYNGKGYKIEASVDFGASWVVVASVAASLSSYPDKFDGDGPNPAVMYRVSAINSVGNVSEPTSVLVAGLTKTFDAESSGMVALTGWNTADTDLLVNDDFKLSYPSDFRDAHQLLRMKGCLDLSTKLGISAHLLFRWATKPITSGVAKEIKNSLRATYGDEEQWTQVAEQVENPLRDKKEAALVSYLVYKMGIEEPVYIPQIQTPDDLFDYFLIDVKMTSCRTTSRISQGMLSVQLFIQRILMGLEQRHFRFSNDLTPDIIDPHIWSWMSSYSLWHPARMVFLYPENYIRPELRKDKTPFFTDLQHEISQSDITSDTCETAYMNYLNRLEEVGHMQPMGLYNDMDRKLIHVFARTPSTPSVYYYRRCDMSGSYAGIPSPAWTPWEKVDAHIESNYLMPAVFNNRLYIFWPIFRKVSPEGSSLPFYSFKMAWSQYRNGKWSPKKESSDTLGTSKLVWWSDITRLIFQIWKLNSTQLGLGVFFSAGRPDSLDDIGIHSENFYFQDARGEVVSALEELHRYGIKDPYHGNWHTGRLKFPNLCIGENTFTAMLPDMPWPGPRQLTIGGVSIMQLTNSSSVLFPDNANDFDRYLTDSSIKPIDYTEEYYINVPPTSSPFLYNDNKRTFFVFPFNYRSVQYNMFETFYHSYVRRFIRELEKSVANGKGLSGFLTLLNQSDNSYTSYDKSPSGKTEFFDSFYMQGLPPSSHLEKPDESTVDFRIPYGPYSEYNWELFCHIPHLMSNKLSINHQYEAAQKCFHHLFIPMASSAILSDGTTDHGVPQRYWNFLPFYNDAIKVLKIKNIQDLFSRPDSAEELESEVGVWEKNPFDPYALAVSRTGVLEKTIVMNYIDNLVAWGKDLFKRFTSESVNQATELFVMARGILGPRPPDIPPSGIMSIQTWQTLDIISNDDGAGPEFASLWMDFGEAYVQLENMFPVSPVSSSDSDDGKYQSGHLEIMKTPYFCVPRNENLIAYWDTVDQMLYNIRHCMNIEGIAAQPALFPPPINPMLLVQAAASGVDLSSALSDINAAVPYYRFTYMIQKALDMCSDVRALGGLLLSALEKRDAEAIAMIRATQEVTLLNKIRDSKEREVDEATQNVESLNKSLAIAQESYTYYSTRQFMSDLENLHLVLITGAWMLQTISQGIQASASAAHATTPQYTIGGAGYASSPVAVTTYGGQNIGNSLESFGTAMSFLSSYLTYGGTMTSTMAGYERRNDEWQFQSRTWQQRKEEIQSQIVGAQIKEEISAINLSSHDVAIKNASDIQTWMENNKFTNQDLYDWMVNKISYIYNQSYNMAYDIAKKAEKAYQFETGNETSNFIQFGYWDNLKNGLLAGESLHADLKTLEKAYIDQNKRYFEITKTISLTMINPKALLDLTEKGSCTFELHDLLFDMDFPGHFRRTIKSVSITIPCVVGPYSSVNAVLTLISSRIRTDTKTLGNPEDFYSEKHYKSNYSSSQSIATSHAQNDSGVFELNFHDERYLPFEGAGVFSQWLLEIPQQNFDLSTITDPMITVRYTSQDAGSSLRTAARAAYHSRLSKVASSGLMRLFSVRHEFASQWASFLNPDDGVPNQSLKLALRKEHFPFQLDFSSIKVNKVGVYLKLQKDKFQKQSPPALTFALITPVPTDIHPLRIDDTDFMIHYMMHWQSAVRPIPATGLTIDFEIPRKSIPDDLRKKDDTGKPLVDSEGHYTLDADAIEDLGIFCYYTATPKDMPKYFGASS
jgi:Tc toxin complex TcA C-terminal TcB-binding domain/Neuraminidase-like domain/Salmonella virulence plasmid 28.1kDa A protein/Fibronectin type III domain